MTRPARLPLLIALSLLTAGLALAGTPSTLASEEVGAERTHAGEQGPRNLTLEGTITNATSNATVAGVEIRVHNLWTSDDGTTKSRESFTVETDEQGRYSLNVSQGVVDLYVDDERFQRAHAEFEIDEDLQLDLPLEPASQDLARVHGTVTSDDGEPIEDAYVRVSAIPEDCGEEGCERHHRTARADGGSGSSRQVETDQGPVEIRYEPRQDRYVSTETDEGGSYEVRVPSGSYEVSVNAQDHLSERVQVQAPEGGQAKADVSLTPIPPASVTVEGQIVDAEDGEPIRGAEIRLYNQRWGTHNGTMTDEEGRFELAIEPGYTGVQIEADESYHVPCEEGNSADGEAEHGKARPVEPGDCDTRRERSHAYLPVAAVIQPDAGEQVRIDEALEREPQPDSHLEGWVVNASSGEAVPNASLHVVNEATNEWGRAETGDDGSFRIAVDEGYYTVRVHAEGYYDNATNVRVDADGTRTTVQVTPGQAADRGGCCYRTPVMETSHEAGGSDGAAETDEARETPSSSASGDEVYAGGPGQLGHPNAQSTGTTQPAPAAGLIGTLAGLLAAVGLGARLRT